MKEYRTIITIPVTVTEEHHQKNVELMNDLNRCFDEGFEVKHITSVVINNEMYVYHFLEKEKEK